MTPTQEQIEEARNLLKNWESKFSELISPSKAIKALEVQGNNLIISFESELPANFQVIDTNFNINGYVYDLLQAAKLIATSEQKKEGAKILEEIIQREKKKGGYGHRRIGYCLIEAQNKILTPETQQTISSKSNKND